VIVIRFRCPQCGKGLAVMEESAGRNVRCPRCKEKTVAPTMSETPNGGQASSHESVSLMAGQTDQGRGLFAGMTRGVRFAVVLVAGMGVLSLLLAVVAPFFPGLGSTVATTAHWAMILFPFSIVLLLVILYGQGTACPTCGKWWAKSEIETGFVDREVYEKQGILVGRSIYKTTYQCDFCKHRWTVTHTDESKGTDRDRKQLGR
jgi:phage FluMu protein Com